MEILTVVSEICSIIGVLISLIVASKVVKMSKSFNHNSGEIQNGDGEKIIVKDRSVLVKDNGKATYYDYTNANIVGEDDSPPVLEENVYPIKMSNVDFYKENIAKDTFKMVEIYHENLIILEADFTNTYVRPEINRWIGYSIKSLPMKDWRSFVSDAFYLEFNYMAIGSIDKIWIEITNFALGKKIYKEPLALTKNKERYSLELKNFNNMIKDWQSVDEICIVAFPEECVGKKG